MRKVSPGTGVFPLSMSSHSTTSEDGGGGGDGGDGRVGSEACAGGKLDLDLFQSNGSLGDGGGGGGGGGGGSGGGGSGSMGVESDTTTTNHLVVDNGDNINLLGDDDSRGMMQGMVGSRTEVTEEFFDSDDSSMSPGTPTGRRSLVVVGKENISFFYTYS